MVINKGSLGLWIIIFKVQVVKFITKQFLLILINKFIPMAKQYLLRINQYFIKFIVIFKLVIIEVYQY